jgi:hypothetical protein
MSMGTASYQLPFLMTTQFWYKLRASPPVLLSMSLWIKNTKCLTLAALFIFGATPVTGTAYTWELLIANHLDQSLWSTNQKYWAAVRSNLVHSCLEVHNGVATFPCHGKLLEFGAGKPISSAKRAHFDFLTINFIVGTHILSTGGDALRKKIGRLFCCCLILTVKLKTCLLLSKQSLKAT